jgi:two-component system, cell cycle response regulator
MEKKKNKRPPKCILIADDSPTMRMMVTEILETRGYRVIKAEDGLEAAILAYQYHPDLIVSDIEMPKMDGYQVSRLLKNDPQMADIPIIILTSKDSSGAIFWGYQTGADLYLLKDFKADDLNQVVADLLKKHETTAGRLHSSEGGPVDAIQILAKLNRYMDSQLFEVTLINEINRIAVGMTSLSDTLGNLLSVLDRAIENHLVGFAIFLGATDILLTIRIGRGISERLLERFQLQILEDLAILCNTDITESKIEMEICEGQTITAGTGTPDLEPSLIYSIPIRAKEENIGILNIYHPQMESLPVQQKQLLGRLSSHISATISTTLLYDRIKNLSVIDGLTQLYNRRHIMEAYRLEFSKSERYDSDLSLMMIDIDDFKKINDSYGHLTGDLVLRHLAGIMKSNIRNIDLPGRYGGEEFLIVLPGTRKESALVVAERIREQVQGYHFKTMNNEPVSVTISIGLCSFSDVEIRNNELELIKIADSRLYAAKKTGKNKVVSE